MSFLGSAYPLFFDFLKFAFIFLFVFLLIVGVYGLAKNSIGDNCSNIANLTEDFCEINEVTKYSHFNNYTENKPDNVLTSLNLAATIVLIFFIMKFRHFHEITELELDRSLLSPSDFTFMVEKIPLFEKEEDIKKFFEEYTEAYKVNIKKIIKAYQIGEYVGLQRQKENLEKNLEKCLQDHEHNNERKIETLNQQISNMQEKIKDVEKGFENMESKFTGVAFITVNTEKGLKIFK